MTEIQARNQVHFGAETIDLAGLEAETRLRLAGADHGSQRTVFVVDSMRHAIGCVAFGVSEDLDFGLIERGRLSPEVVERFVEHGVRLVDAETGALVGGAAQGPVEPGRITVMTSGTTGLLKLIPHTARTLNTFDRVRDLPGNSWFLPYQVGSYAWYQMIAMALFQPGQNLVPGDIGDLVGSFEAALARGQVSAISSTPTFWRLVIMSIDEAVLAGAGLRSLTLGGEIVDQAILDRLSALYPDARIRHIYASSEAGAAIVVSDGKAGFDAALLDRDTGKNGTGKIGIRVDDGRLFVRSPYSNRADAEGWVDTGDLVERRGDRLYFLGRDGHGMINVGGQKAFAPDIEAHLMAHPDVIWVRVSARKVPMMGSLPVADVVLARPMEPDAAELMLNAHCETRLADYAVPRMWTFLDTVPMRASLKS